MTAPTSRKRHGALSTLFVGLSATLIQTAGAAPDSAMPRNSLWGELRATAMVSCPLDSPLPRSLVAAAACDDLERLQARIAQGADLLARDERALYAGRTALHHASQLGNPGAVELLLEGGADPDAQDAQGNTALHLLTLRRPVAGDGEIAAMLIEYGADARIRNQAGRDPAEALADYELRLIQPLRLSQDEFKETLARAMHDGPRKPPARPVPMPAEEPAAEPPEAGPMSAEPAEAPAPAAPAQESATAPAPEPMAAPAPPPAPEAAPVVAAKAEPMPAPVPAAIPAPTPAPEVKPEPTPEAPAAATTQAAPTDTAARPKPESGSDEATASPASVRAALDAWAAAWSARDVDSYLAHYSSGFKPADGNTLEDWKAQRRLRVGKPDAIQVTLSEVVIELDGKRATARFVQDYQSDSFKVVDRKLLLFVREGRRWLIVEERTGD